MAGVRADLFAHAMEIAGVLGPLVTTAHVTQLADALGIEANQSNKVAKIQGVLFALLRDGRRVDRVEPVVTQLVACAYSRHVTLVSQHRTDVPAMTALHVETVMSALGAMGHGYRDLDVYRVKLGGEPTPKKPPKRSPVAAPKRADAPLRAASAPPRRHDDVLAHLATITDHPPQRRGLELEPLIISMVATEGFSCRGSMRNPGEQIDGFFVIDGRHFLLECKWEKDPIGLPDVRDFAGKVHTKARDTFGVFISMTGFVGDINDTVARGQPLAVLGLDADHVMSVAYGETTWRAVIASALEHVHGRTRFYSPTRRR